MTRSILSFVLLTSLLAATAAQAQDDPGLKVYQRVNPSVVSLKSI